MGLVLVALGCLVLVVLVGAFLVRRKPPVCDVCGAAVEPDAATCPVCGADFMDPDRQYHSLT